MTTPKTQTPIEAADGQALLKTILAGNATITLVSNKTNNRFTFKIKQKDDMALWFVRLLQGPDTYGFLGVIDNKEYKSRLSLRLTKNSCASADSQAYQALQYALYKLQTTTPTNFTIYHSGTCCKCGRELTDPESIKLGIGPKCRS